MARNENPPFMRGATWGNGNTVAATDGAQYEGKEYVFEDVADRPLSTAFRSNRYVRCRVVRNNSGGTLTAPAKLIVTLDLGGAAVQNAGSEVSGIATSVANKGYPVDEYLGTTNVLANDLFYVVVDGPAKCRTDSANGPGTSVANNVVRGNTVVPGSTTAGTVTTQDNTLPVSNATTLTLIQNLQNAIGKALESIAAFSTDINIDVGGHNR